MKIEIKDINGIKKFNNLQIEEILKKVSSNDDDYFVIKSICDKVSSYQDLILELKKLKIKKTPASIMLIIKIIGNLTLIDAYSVFDDVMTD